MDKGFDNDDDNDDQQLIPLVDPIKINDRTSIHAGII